MSILRKEPFQIYLGFRRNATILNVAPFPYVNVLLIRAYSWSCNPKYIGIDGYGLKNKCNNEILHSNERREIRKDSITVQISIR